MLSQHSSSELVTLVDNISSLEAKEMLSTQDVINLAVCVRRAKKNISESLQGTTIEIPVQVDNSLKNLTSRVSETDKLLADSIVEYWTLISKPELNVAVRKEADVEVMIGSSLADVKSSVTESRVASYTSKRSWPTIAQTMKHKLAYKAATSKIISQHRNAISLGSIRPNHELVESKGRIRCHVMLKKTK